MHLHSRPTLISACLVLLGSLVSNPCAQEPTSTQTEPVVDVGAKQLWDGFLAASRPGEEAREPITSFHLEAALRVRQEGSNDVQVAYDFQSPNFMRSTIASGRTIGRGPGRGLSAYWLKDGDDFTRLEEYEHATDRRQIDDLLSLAKNFVALSDPGRLRIERLQSSSAPRDILPSPRIPGTLTLRWVRLSSSDFSVPASGTGASRFKPQKAIPRWVQIGFDRKSNLPRLVVIGSEYLEQLDLRQEARAVLIHLPKKSFTLAGGFLIPGRFHVHELAFEQGVVRFAAKASQEVTLQAANLRPQFQSGHFDGK